MKKIKRKTKTKNNIMIISILLIIIIGIITITYIVYDRKNTLNIIKKNYNEYVETKATTKIYNKNKKQIGTISKGYKLQLEKIKKLTINNKYLKIKDYNYYIDCKNIKKTKKFENKQKYNHIVLNKNIKSNKKINLLKNNKKTITLYNINQPIEYMDDNYYYIKLFNEIFQIKNKKI